ncbi:MAG: RHS repeat-associated core domain-containing protein, partial [Bacteroidota bacterium]
NVDFLVQEFQTLDDTEHRYKTIEYDYDYISGNVHALIYQRGKADQFAYRYEYDKTNRLSAVFTSEHETEHPESALWKRDAAYSYYDHGPMRRMIFGQDRLQGVDYTYTIQGWIRGINGKFGGDFNAIFSSRPNRQDINMDGLVADQATIDQVSYRDLFGYGNAYFEDDYTPIAMDVIFDRNPQNDYIFSNEELFNGNIARYMYNSAAESHRSRHIKATYDQLNRIVTAPVELTLTNPWGVQASEPMTWGVTGQYQYDGNGNLLSLGRNGRVRMPSFNVETENNAISYQYQAGTNLLTSVSGTVSSSGGPFSSYYQIDGTQTYTYDPAGNIYREIVNNVGNYSERIIRWTPYGKAESIDIFDNGGSRINWTQYQFGPDQNRWERMFTAPNNHPPGEQFQREYYVRDAQGNTLATYARASGSFSSNYKEVELREQYLYGSSRLGQVTRNRTIPDSEIDAPDPNALLSGTNTGVANYVSARLYELTNHLGNVTTVFSEDLTEYTDIYQTGGNATFTAPTIRRYREYTPFGLDIQQTANSPYNATGSYRYGFNGKESDENNEFGAATHYDYGFRVYNPAIARFLSVDPLAPDYPWYTPYQFAGNKPVWAVDLDGLEEFFVTRWYENGRFYSRISLTMVDNPQGSGTTAQRGQYTDREHRVQYTTTELDGTTSTSYSPNLAPHELAALNNLTAEEGYYVENVGRNTLKAGYYERTSSIPFTPPPPPVPPTSEVVTPTPSNPPNPPTDPLTPPPTSVPPIRFIGGGFTIDDPTDYWNRAFFIAQWLVQNPDFNIRILSDAMGAQDPNFGNPNITFDTVIPGSGGVTYGQRLNDLLDRYRRDILIQGRNGFGVRLDPSRVETGR